MKGFLNLPAVYLEIGQQQLHALEGNRGLDLPLERQPGGRLTDACKKRTAAALQAFLAHKSWQPRVRAICAIGVRGVSLRRFTLPGAGKDDFQRLLRMQIEADFPLAPDELAWGCRIVGETRQNGSNKQDVLVMAVKKEVVEEYSAILADCGMNPLFTLAALARNEVCPATAGLYAILDLAEQCSELALFDGGVPTTVRALPWGAELSGCTDAALDALARSGNGDWPGRKIFVAGRTADSVSGRIVERFGGGVRCEPLKIPTGQGRTAAVLGLKKAVEAGNGNLLLFEIKPVNGGKGLTHPAPVKWALLAAGLLIASLLIPYAQALALKPWLARKFAAIKADSSRLEIIDRELGFLQYLKQNQPPYLDALYLFSKSAPQGAKIDSLTMSRRGEVSLRGSMRNADQVAEFRTKLIGSGFFSAVVVEEQTPTPDRQKVNVRMTAQWKPPEQLQGLKFGPTAEEVAKAKTRKDTPMGGTPGGMPPGFPGGMMPGGPMPGGAMPPGMMIPPGAMPPGAVQLGVPPGVEIRSGPVPAAVPRVKESKP